MTVNDIIMRDPLIKLAGMYEYKPIYLCYWEGRDLGLPNAIFEQKEDAEEWVRAFNTSNYALGKLFVLEEKVVIGKEKK